MAVVPFSHPSRTLRFGGFYLIALACCSREADPCKAASRALMEHKMADSSEEEEDLELPPEIWRLVCDCLRPPQLGRLARTSRDVRTAVRGSPAFRQILRCDGVWEDVHERSILGVAVAGDSIVTASEDRTLKVLDGADGSCRAILAEHTNRVRCVCVMPDGRIVSGSRDKSLIVWAPDGSHLRTLEGHQDFVWCVAALSEDRVASGARDGRIRIFDVNTGFQILVFTPSSTVRCLAALPDGTLIADAGGGRLIRWDVSNRPCRIRGISGEEQSQNITSVAVVSEGVVLAGRENGSLTLWNMTAAVPDNYTKIRCHEAAVWALASLPNERVVAADGDGVLKVWRADLALPREHALTCLQTLRGHARAAFCLAALPDGRIVSGSMDRTLRFWAPVGTQIDRAPADV